MVSSENLMRKDDMTVSSYNSMSNQISPSKHLKGKVYITYNICETCNLNCLFCCIDSSYHGKKYISKENSDIILNKIKEEFDIDTIFIMANEPTTQPEVANHIMKYAIKNNIKIKIVSNGFAPISVYEKMLDNIEPSKLDKITISLDSMDKNIHNKIRNNNKSFSNAIRTIKYLKNNKYNVRVQMTICEINYDTIIDSVIKLNKDYEITNFAFHCMSVSDIARQNKLNHLNAIQWRKLVTNLFNLKPTLNNIKEFSVPIIAMTENELLRLYFSNDKKMLNKFLKGMPLKLCPAINGNNIYLKATNDDAIISRCQILFDNVGYYSLKYDYQKNRFIKNNKNNDFEFIKKSKTLCPVIYTELNKDKDYEIDDNGNKLYYVCRTLIANPEDLDF